MDQSGRIGIICCLVGLVVYWIGLPVEIIFEIAAGLFVLFLFVRYCLVPSQHKSPLRGSRHEEEELVALNDTFLRAFHNTYTGS